MPPVVAAVNHLVMADFALSATLPIIVRSFDPLEREVAMADSEQETPAGESTEELPPFKIEEARSSRSKCKTCRRPIQKEKLRIGVLIEGPFGPGYLWHHLQCAARKRFDDVAAAYEQKCYPDGLELPTLDSLRTLIEHEEQKKKEKKVPPYVEVAPTARSKCKRCDEPIEKGAYRVGLLRNVEFYGQVRSGPINVHPKCVADELRADDCATEIEGFEDALRANSEGVDAAQIDEVLRMIGEIA